MLTIEGQKSKKKQEGESVEKADCVKQREINFPAPKELNDKCNLSRLMMRQN